MIDLDRIEEWNENDLGEESYEVQAIVSKGDLLDVINRLRQAEKDAARYRWLRESASTEDHGGLAYDFRLVDAIRYMPGPVPNETMDIDEAIDEAMQCK